MEYRSYNKILANGWVLCGSALQKYIRNLQYGRESEIDSSYKNWRVLYDCLNAFENQSPCEDSPFAITVNGRVLSVNLNPTVITSETLETARCPCDTRCMTDAQVNKLEEIIIQIAKTC